VTPYGWDRSSIATEPANGARVGGRGLGGRDSPITTDRKLTLAALLRSRKKKTAVRAFLFAFWELAAEISGGSEVFDRSPPSIPAARDETLLQHLVRRHVTARHSAEIQFFSATLAARRT